MPSPAQATLYELRNISYVKDSRLPYLVTRLENLCLYSVSIYSLNSLECILAPFPCALRHMDKVVLPIFRVCCAEEGFEVAVSHTLYPPEPVGLYKLPWYTVRFYFPHALRG